MGPTDLGNHYLQNQEPQVGHTGEITVKVGQASKTGNGQGSPSPIVSSHVTYEMRPVFKTTDKRPA